MRSSVNWQHRLYPQSMSNLSAGIGLLVKKRSMHFFNTLEHIGVINIVGYRNASKVGKGAKLLLAGPSLYACLGGNAWSSCEAYVVTMLRAAGHQVFDCKDEAQRDFEVGKFTIEIG